jgi:hypothetical protein
VALHRRMSAPPRKTWLIQSRREWLVGAIQAAE